MVITRAVKFTNRALRFVIHELHMAVVGHWLVGFLFSYCFPQTGVALFSS